MTVNKTATAVAWCDVHGKLTYASRKAARRIANKMHVHKTPYPCNEEKTLWHIGALHPLVMQGKKTRNEIGRAS